MSSTRTNDGYDLEHRAAAYFQAHGYFVRRGVKLSVAAGTKEATDIDVLGIRFTPPILEERIVVDCRDRKRPKPFERILWTKGLSSFAAADRSIVVTPNAPWQAREFGSLAGVQILESSVIDDYLSSVSEFTPFGEANSELSNRVKALRSEIDRDRKAIELHRERLRVRQLLVVGNPITNFNRIIRAIAYIHKILSRSPGNLSELAGIYLLDAAAISSVMLVRFSSESKWTPEKDWASNLRKKLTYGDVPPKKAQQLTSLAFKKDFFEGLPVPHYVDEITELVKHLISRPLLAAGVPIGVDFLLFGRVVGGIAGDHLSSIIGQPQDEILRISRRVLSAISYAADIPSKTWENTPTASVIETSEQQRLPLGENSEP
jgi:hypothetical protein